MYTCIYSDLAQGNYECTVENVLMVLDELSH